MPTLDHARLIRRLEVIAHVGPRQRQLLSALPLRPRRFEENSDIVSQGSKPTECCLLVDGLAGRYTVVSGGRQILSLHFSGDIPDLQSLHLDIMDHGIFAMTPVRVAFIPHEAIRQILRESEALADIVMRAALIDAAIFRQWIANIGRRDAYGRIAHIFCEVYVRMGALGLAEKDSFRLPMTQAELGDATGLSPVHVNRVLQRMRREGLIASKGDVHAIADWERLQQAADFDEDYLHQRRGDNDGA